MYVKWLELALWSLHHPPVVHMFTYTHKQWLELVEAFLHLTNVQMCIYTFLSVYMFEVVEACWNLLTGAYFVSSTKCVYMIPSFLFFPYHWPAPRVQPGTILVPVASYKQTGSQLPGAISFGPCQLYTYFLSIF